MGYSDCITILGNRNCLQSGLNFDRLDFSGKNPKEAPDFLPLVISTILPPRRKQFRKPFSAEQVENELCTQEEGSEGSDLIIEAFLVNKTSEMDNNPFARLMRTGIDNPFDTRYEGWVKRTVLPHILETRLYSACAEADSWVFVPSRSLFDFNASLLPKPFCYFNYHDSGMFQFTGCGEDMDCNEQDRMEDHLAMNDIFTRFDDKIHQIWFRVWYRQVWKGIIQEKRYKSSEITDPCLVWTAYELGIIVKKEVVTLSRCELWDKCHIVALERYFPKLYFKEVFLPLFYAHKLDEKCPLHKDSFPEDLFLYIASFVFGDCILKRAFQSRTSTSVKKIKLE